MKQIIYIEWLKVKQYRTFWVMLILALAVIPGGNFIVASKFNESPKELSKLLGNPFSFPDVWLTTAVTSSYISIMGGLLLIILVTNEFTYRTHRQNIIDGWDRKDFVLAKLFWLVSVAVLTLVVATLSGAAIGWIYGNTSFSLEGYQYMLYYFMQVLVMLTIALLLGILLKRAGLSIVLFLAYNMMLDQVLSFLIKKSAGKIGGLLPLQSGDELLPFPLVGKMIAVDDQYDTQVYVIAMFAYIALGIWLVFRKMLKSDL
ncbi:ABC transporter permease [Chitinophaga sp. 212800010-3]|uniref:ABC transporter permease n=1 Tax=unclassified Chitinophaga TaxID=2619133 RepID=UPI002DE873E4|nr:ABC-2 family transporter protein [Chitinophaga sp. 212800010-3]